MATRGWISAWAWIVGGAVLVDLVLAVPSAAAELPPVEGRVVAVTLYRDQAMVTRSVPVQAPAGAVELVVSNLPQQVVPESLFGEGSDGIEIRAVRFRTQALGEEPREEIRTLDREIQKVQDGIARNKKMQELVSQRLSYLDKLEGFTAPTATVELSKGVLNVEALEKITLFSFEQRQVAAQESLKLATDGRDLAEQLSLLQRKRSELTSAASRTAHEAVVFLEKRGAGRGEVKLSYAVKNAGWSPAYNVRSADDRKTVTVEYNATIHQMSGEDWNGVTLALSTASPALSAQGPGLGPFWVSLSGRPGQQPAQQQVDIAQGVRSSQARLQQAQRRQASAQLWVENLESNWLMNIAANDLQSLELQAEKDALEIIKMEAPAATEGPSVSYRLANPVSLASRADQQILRISETKLASDFYHVATPVLTGYVYREAHLTNTGEEVLLSGPVSVYLDGRFVGRAEIPTVARGQTFVMGFGADPQLRAKRELVDRTEQVQGGNQEISLSYRVVLENYKDAPVSVRVFERLPKAERDTDVRVTLGDLEDKLSEEELYLRLEKPKGILRWEIDVPARAAGAKARTLEYSYKLEFDRNLRMTKRAESQLKQMRQELDELERARKGM